MAPDLLADSGGPALVEQLFRRDGEAIDDLGRAVGHFQHAVAKRAAELTRISLAGGELDPADAGLAFGTDDIAFSHGAIMRDLVNRSTTDGHSRGVEGGGDESAGSQTELCSWWENYGQELRGRGGKGNRIAQPAGPHCVGR